MFKKSMAILLSVIMVIAFITACRNEDDTPDPPADTGQETNDTEPENDDVTPEPGEDGGVSIQELIAMFDQVTDSSDLPSWQGEVLELSMWMAHGMGHADIHISPGDVWWPEIERIFGIRFSDDSFDNGGMDFETRLTLLASTGDWPDIGQSVIQTGELIEEGLLHDLTDLLPIYAPHYWEIINRVSPTSTANGWLRTGRLYGIEWFDNTLDQMLVHYPDLDTMRWQYVRTPELWTYPLTIRDDIIQIIFPDAKSMDDIEALWMEQGYFTREQVFDIPLNSREDVIDFLYRVQEVIIEYDIRVDGRLIDTIYMTYGADADIWPIMMYFFLPMHGMGLHAWNYFMAWNTETNQLERSFATDFFKEEMRTLNQLVRDGVGSEESLMTTQDLFERKLHSGEYAVTYVWFTPDRDMIRENHDFRYRPVWLNIPNVYDTYKRFAGEMDVSRGGVSIFSHVDEAYVPQILAMLNFMYTEVGMKLQLWGPRTAGLFEELPDGTRRYTDPELEAAMVFMEPNGRCIYFNLSSGILGMPGGNTWHPPSWPYVTAGFAAGGIMNPKYHDYDMLALPREPGQAETFFTSALFLEEALFGPSLSFDFYPWSFFHIAPELITWWDARNAWEHDAMKRILASRTDEEFEENFQRMIDISEDAGFTEDVLRAIEAYLQENQPDDWEAMTNPVRMN